jgi:hypothetical protein
MNARKSMPNTGGKDRFSRPSGTRRAYPATRHFALGYFQPELPKLVDKREFVF